MTASIDWVAIGTMGAFILTGLSGLALFSRWLRHHVVRPLRIVTGEPETDDDPGKPSLYQLTKEAKETGEKALAIAEKAADDVAYVKTQIAPSNGKRTAEIVEEARRDLAELRRDVDVLKAKAV